MKFNRTEKRQFNKWVTALYENKHKQGTQRLQDFDGGYYCLGVGVDVCVPKHQQHRSPSGHLIGTTPSLQGCPLRWLNNINDDFLFITELSLMELNDKREATFPEIAMMLDLVYNYNAYGKS